MRPSDGECVHNKADISYLADGCELEKYISVAEMCMTRGDAGGQSLHNGVMGARVDEGNTQVKYMH